MLENHTLTRRIGVLLAVPVASAGLIGAAQLLAPKSQPPTSAQLVSRNGAGAEAPAGGQAGNGSGPAATSASAPTGVAPLRRDGAAPGLVVRGRYVLRGPSAVPKGSSVVFVLQGPVRVVRGARTAPYTVALDTRTIPDGDYRLAVQTVRGGGKRSLVRLQHLTVANHRVPGRPPAAPAGPADTPAGGASTAPAGPADTPTGGSGASPTSSSGAAPTSSTSATTTRPTASTATTSRSSTTSSTTRSAPSTAATSTAGSSSSSGYLDQVAALTNKERLNAGCPALVVNATLTSVAQAHSEDMAAHNYFDHNSQDGRSPFDRMSAAGYRYSTAAENIAAGQRTPQDVVTAWMNSAGHRANILNCKLTQIGVGYATGGQYGSYWTQDFGTPR